MLIDFQDYNSKAIIEVIIYVDCLLQTSAAWLLRIIVHKMYSLAPCAAKLMTIDTNVAMEIQKCHFSLISALQENTKLLIIIIISL